MNHLVKFIFLSITACLVWGCQADFQPAPETDQHAFVQYEDTQIPVWIRGNTQSGKILLYIQGGPGGSSMDFAAIDYPEWKGSLEQEVAVAYYDQLGTGNQQGQFDPTDISLDRYVEEIHAVSSFLEEKYQAEVILLGHSFGGAMVYRYMIEKKQEAIPTRFIALNGPATNDRDSMRWVFRREFLYNTAQLEIATGRNTPQWEEVLEWLEERPVITNLPGDDPFADKRQWNAYTNELVYSYYMEKELGAREVFQVLFNSPYNLFPAYLSSGARNDMLDILFEEINSTSLLDQLDEIDLPVLLLTGRYDDLVPPAELNYIYAHISSSEKRIEILEDAGHESFVHQPEAFSRIILDFIN